MGQVTGRIKEQYKLENGKYVVPAPLEDGITRSLFIAQVRTPLVGLTVRSAVQCSAVLLGCVVHRRMRLSFLSWGISVVLD